jgi:hypothetical protein
METQTNMRTISEIAREIKKVWGGKVYFGARPYLDAMISLTDKNSMYYQDDAKSVVLYFLSNASTFRGEDAKRLKLELKEVIK